METNSKGKRMVFEEDIKYLQELKVENISSKTVGRVVDTNNITTLSDEVCNALKCGDMVNKVDSTGKHSYRVSYKKDKGGMCLTYSDASCVETVSYDYTAGHWVYNSKDVTTIENRQEELVSGTNIKTINNESILGSGNITIDSGAHLYMHTMYISCANSMSFSLTLLLPQSTAIADTDELYDIIKPIYLKSNNDPRYTNLGVTLNNEVVSSVGVYPAYVNSITKTTNGITVDIYCREASGNATSKSFIRQSKTISDYVTQIF